MKTSLLFLSAAMLLVAVGFSSCSTTTLANRHDLFSPDGIEGPYTQQYKGR